MDSVDLQVLRTVRDWRRENHRVDLVTVIETWGSSPRPPGAMLAIRNDGQIVGSVSGGCVEDDLIERMRNAAPNVGKPDLISYGVTKVEAARFGLPCGGTLRLVQEEITDVQWVAELIERTTHHQLVARQLDMETGKVTIASARRDDRLMFDGKVLRTIHGPRWRMLIIGAGNTSRYLAQMAQALDFEVIVCDPREEYLAAWDVPGATIRSEMPDDLVLALELDRHSAVVAVPHDPKLDDMALLEALKSDAFYVGALGSHANTAKRKERLALFDLSRQQIDRLHAPIGLRIGSRTQPEIAIAVLAELIALKNALKVDPPLEHGVDTALNHYPKAEIFGECHVAN
jgi:xanthine dehydrogenase accessory factor